MMVKKIFCILTVFLWVACVPAAKGVLANAGVLCGPGMELESQNLSVWPRQSVWCKNFTTHSDEKQVLDFYRTVLSQSGWVEKQAVGFTPIIVFEKNGAKTMVEFIKTGHDSGNIARVSFVLGFDGDWNEVVPREMLEVYPYGKTELFRHIAKSDTHTFMRVVECADGPDIFMRYACKVLLDRGWHYHPELAQAATHGVVIKNLVIFNRPGEQFTVLSAKHGIGKWNYTLIASKGNIESLAKE